VYLAVAILVTSVVMEFSLLWLLWSQKNCLLEQRRVEESRKAMRRETTLDHQIKRGREEGELRENS
jgi:hypothetical protein